MSARTVYYPDDDDQVIIRSYIHDKTRWVALDAPGLSINANGAERVARLRKLAEHLMLACDAAEDAPTDVDHDITESIIVPATAVTA